MQHVAHLQASWLYESSPHIRNLTSAKYHYDFASLDAAPSEFFILQWVRFRLHTRAILDAIQYRDWTRAFLND